SRRPRRLTSVPATGCCRTWSPSRAGREPGVAGAVQRVRTDSVEGRPTEDAVLVERSRNGDHDAYAELVTRYQAIAARTAYVITGTAADAEDVAQDAFVKAYYALD